MSLALALCALCGCGDDPALIEIPALLPARDAAVGVPIPDGAVQCADDEDCNDAIACTKDSCQPGGFCVNAADNGRCSDGVFCNGQEVCDPSFGCVEGRPPSCNDSDVCTLDRCDEQKKVCAHDPRDFDDDGEVDWHCFEGTDCDDFDATRGATVAEICADDVDNDCDGRVDETNDCGRPDHDRCEDALDVSAGGAYEASLRGTVSDYALACATLSTGDIAFTFTTRKPQDVTLIARGLLSDGSEEIATVAVRSDCNDLESELDCRRGFPGQVRMRALPAGRYFAIVTSDAPDVVLDVRFDEPTEAPANNVCQRALDVSAGGRFDGDFVDVSDDTTIPCGFRQAGDLFYSFTTTEEHDVEISAISVTGDRMNFAVRSVCDEPETTLRCESDAPALARLHELPAGTHYIVLEGSPAREIDFHLDVAFLDPTPPPPGDGCGLAIDLEIGQSTSGTLAERQDLVNVLCGCPADEVETCGLFFRDSVYRVVVDEPTDLHVDIEGGPALMSYDFRDVCTDGESQLSCGDGAPVDARVRNVKPGEYFLVVESPDSTPFQIQVDKLPLTVPIEVEGNDTCATAIVVPPTGGLFLGDTLTLFGDYQATCGGNARSHDAAFVLTLDTATRVTASLEGGHDTVLYRYVDTGLGPETCRSLADAACNDDTGQGNTNSILEEMLPAGTYYYVVDGFSDSNNGSYILEIQVGEP